MSERSHVTAHDLAIPRRTRRALVIVAGGLALVTAVGVSALGFGNDVSGGEGLNLVSRVYEAEVVEIERVPCAGTTEEDDVQCDAVDLRLDQGPDAGDTITIEFADTATAPELSTGDEIVLNYNPDADPGFRYQFADRQRRPVLLWLTALFALSVVLLGRLRGLAALVGLGASIFVVLQFVLPAVLDGRSPVLVAVFGASAIAYLALYVAHGFKPMTTVALLGTLGSLGLTVLLASVFTALAQFSGFSSEEAALVQIGSADLDLTGLVLAGMVLGALGALDDMTVTQASAVWELRAANPGMPRRALVRSALRIGRDHVASTVNTLALAYMGASLPLLILLVQSQQSLGTVANSETVATEIVRTLVGSIGLVASVPLTTYLAVYVVSVAGAGTGGRRGRRRRRPGPPTPVGADAEPPSPPTPEDQGPETAAAPPSPPPAPKRPAREQTTEQEFWDRRLDDDGPV